MSLTQLVKTVHSIIIFWPNTSLGPFSFMFVSHRSFKFLRFQIDPLSFKFVSDRSFKFLRFQIDPLNFEFVSDMSFKFIRFHIGPLSLEFVSNRSFDFGLTEVDRNDLSETNSKLKGPI